MKKLIKHNCKTRLKRIRTLPVFGRMTLTKGQETALDTIWAKAVKARAWETCEYCLKSGIRLEAHHVIGRRNKSLRHLVSNGVSLCHAHHRFAEQNGVAFAEWILKKRGQDWWDSLQAYGREIKIFKDYTIVKAYLESFL